MNEQETRRTPGRLMRRLILGLALAPVAGQAAAQATLAGRVIDDQSGRPMPGVEVLLDGRELRATTDSAGQYLISGLPAGRRPLVFRLVGYRPVRTSALLIRGDTTRLEIRMTAEGVELDSIVVTEKPVISMGLDGFAERKSRGFGIFFDSTELRRRDQLTSADLLGRFASIVIQRQPGGHYAVNTRSNCAMAVRLDGALIGGGGFLEPPDLRSFGVHSLAAIEVYRSPAEVPLEYGGRNATCGLILLWTRRGP